MLLYLGIDIGGTKIAGGAVTDSGEMVEQAHHPTEAHLGAASVLDAALEVAAELLQKYPDVAAVGIGAGGQVDAKRGVVVSATDVLPGWTGTDIRAAFATRFGVPIAVDNDVNALAAGELLFGVAKREKTVAFLALGTGVGGALIVHGKLHHGAHWSGGELGHILLDIGKNARRDIGGAQGTLEAYCSGSGLVRSWREITGDWDREISGKEIGECAIAEPNSAEATAVAKTGEYLGFGLVTIANAIDPDMIVIGGGLSGLGDLLLDPARNVLKERALLGPSTCPVVAATLGEDASVIGASALPVVSLKHWSSQHSAQ